MDKTPQHVRDCENCKKTEGEREEEEENTRSTKIIIKQSVSLGKTARRKERK